MWVKGEIFRDLGDVDSVAKGMLGRDTQSSLFDRLDWLRRTAAICRPMDRPLVVRARAEGSDAWLFLAETAPGRATGLTSWYTLAFRAIFTGEPDERSQRAMLTAIARRLRPRLATIVLDHVPDNDADLLAASFRRGGWVAFVTPQVANWSVAVTGKDFATYWAERPGQLRSTAKRKAAKAAMDIEIVDRFDETVWNDYAAIYDASWKPEEGSLDFVRAMALDEAAAGALRMGVARIDGQPVAAQLWTVDHGIAIIHKLAHREDAAHLSPGTILSRAMFEYVIDCDRVARIDFGTGDDGYKADWMNDRAMRMRVELCNLRRFAGLFAAAKAQARALAARLATR
jgi:Acetyltransferase (GNAT) domain